MPQDVAPPVTAATDTSDAPSQPAWAPDIPWLQPFPDRLLEPTAPAETEPEATLISRETIELVFLAALQHLPPRQRAILLMRDLLDWSARETADLLQTSVASVNSAHQRARATMRARHPARAEQPRSALNAQSSAGPGDAERALLATFMQAWERADVQRLTALLRDDARWAMPPAPLWFDGRAAILRLFELFPIDWQGRSFRMLATAANRQAATAAYLRSAGETTFSLTALHVLRVEGGQIAEVTTFGRNLCRAFDLPASL
jgi:RNA polymerase sigma-70 factor (ECF subfamily)